MPASPRTTTNRGSPAADAANAPARTARSSSRPTMAGLEMRAGMAAGSYDAPAAACKVLGWADFGGGAVYLGDEVLR